MNRPERLSAAPPSSAADSGKRRAVLDGARRVFRAEGFDGASMDKIAQAAGVSKGTLYVYFRSKEELFSELVIADREEAAEQIFVLTDREGDVREVLTRLGERFLAMMTRSEHIQLIRMVMGAAEKFPDVGRTFYDTGPRCGVETLAEYLQSQVDRGRLRIDEDLHRAASHFLNMCHGAIVKEQLFCHSPPPSPQEIRATVESAVRVFLAAYGSERG